MTLNDERTFLHHTNHDHVGKDKYISGAARAMAMADHCCCDLTSRFLSFLESIRLADKIKMSRSYSCNMHVLFHSIVIVTKGALHRARVKNQLQQPLDDCYLDLLLLSC